MKILITLLLTIVALTSLVNVEAQKRQSVDQDVFNQFASLGEMYRKVPLQLTIQIQNSAIPVTTAKDTLQTTMDLYVGEHFYYMQTEGIEEIITDSLLLMVNREIKEMQLFRSNRDLLARAGNMPAMFMQDSSKILLANKFNASIETLSKEKKKISLISKETVSGTIFPREAVSIVYDPTSFQIIECTQRRAHLIPVDAGLYSSLQQDTALANRLLHRIGTDGDMYFLIKENSITYKFTNIEHTAQHPPVNTMDRIVRGDNERYRPAKGFENYSLSQQF
jgi:hypothetical protein